MTDPTRIDAGIPSLKNVARPKCGIVIAYDPNSGDMQVNVQGFASPVEEIGAFEYAKAMRLEVFMKKSAPQQKSTLITPVSGRLPQ